MRSLYISGKNFQDRVPFFLYDITRFSYETFLNATLEVGSVKLFSRDVSNFLPGSSVSVHVREGSENFGKFARERQLNEFILKTNCIYI